MYRTHTCGELNLKDVNNEVTLAGWVQRSRDHGNMTFIDLRDRYGLTQLVFNNPSSEIFQEARKLGREYVIQVKGIVTERSSKNPKMPTGDIEISVTEIKILNKAETPPFTIEDISDGGDELRMKYRYLDLRRAPLKRNLELRHRLAQEIRRYLDSMKFIEIETPVLMNSTPEGARDFVVPSRMNPGQFYALPQSPQTFKQVLMVAGFDRYFQIVKCFRDEDLRADRQPEFTQIDCEMSFIDREDILNTFEGLTRHLFKTVKGIEFDGAIPRMNYQDAMSQYGVDKPDIRFEMKIHEITGLVKGKGFQAFDSAEYIGAISAKACAEYSRKELDALTEFVKKPQIGAKGLIYARYNSDGSFKSSVDKFYSPDDLGKWFAKLNCEKGDLILVLAGDKKKTLSALGELRLEMAGRLGLKNDNIFKPLWVIDFPLLEWDKETNRFYAMHHPFTSPMDEDIAFFESDPGNVRAKAYDLVINGIEIGGGSIRIFNKEIQQKMFRILGFSAEEAEAKFGFLMNAFRYGAPPHGGIAFGFDRWTALFAGENSIRDVIAFPKNNMGRDMMVNAPSIIADSQLAELNIQIVRKAKNTNENDI